MFRSPRSENQSSPAHGHSIFYAPSSQVTGSRMSFRDSVDLQNHYPSNDVCLGGMSCLFATDMPGTSLAARNRRCRRLNLLKNRAKRGAAPSRPTAANSRRVRSGRTGLGQTNPDQGKCFSLCSLEKGLFGSGEQVEARGLSSTRVRGLRGSGKRAGSGGPHSGQRGKASAHSPGGFKTGDPLTGESKSAALSA